MTPELCAVLARVQEELGVQLDALDRIGGEYARQYAWAATTRPTLTGPPRPVELRPEMGKMIRELVLDELAAQRLTGTATR